MTYQVFCDETILDQLVRLFAERFNIINMRGIPVFVTNA